jgi:uncharacterized protein YbjT (DUF2867 family)
MKILVTGATGYIGGRLVPRLIDAGYSIRCLVRDINRLDGRPWLDKVELIQGDLLIPDTLPQAMAGVDTAYYLVHSMASGPDFHERDLSAARAFGEAAAHHNLRRIIYLGGLGNPESNLSPHLQSRQQTGDVLRYCEVPVTELKAAVIVGSGSLSFEMIRYLTERVPIMICPKWVFTKVQPISINNVLDYLVAVLNCPESIGRIIEIGGANILTYGDMMLQYASVRGLQRWLVPVPVLTPRLSSYWVHIVTPIPAVIARPLVEGLRNEVVVRSDDAVKLFPNIRLLTYEEAVRSALIQLEIGEVETAWSDALSSTQGDVAPVILTISEGLIIEKRQIVVNCEPEALYQSFIRLGGEQGWFYMNWAWEIRGLLDRLVGGVGLRRGRRDPENVRVGDALDFWRVESVVKGSLLRLRAEMKVPGKAWLQFHVKPHKEDQTLFSQTAFFAPKGLSGLIYWYSLYPIHRIIFSGLIKKIAERALK